MDADSIWQLVDAGGALGVLVVIVLYLVQQNRSLQSRNETLVDRQHEAELQHTQALVHLQNAIERVGDKLDG